MKYDSVIQNMWSSGIVHEQKFDRRIFYMPHQPVVRKTAVSSNVRPVFDASTRGYNGVSLNDCMEVGPNLLSSLTEILLHFRRWCIGISSDVEKAFYRSAFLSEIEMCTDSCGIWVGRQSIRDSDVFHLGIVHVCFCSSCSN